MASPSTTKPPTEASPAAERATTVISTTLTLTGS